MNRNCFKAVNWNRIFCMCAKDAHYKTVSWSPLFTISAMFCDLLLVWSKTRPLALDQSQIARTFLGYIWKQATEQYPWNVQTGAIDPHYRFCVMVLKWGRPLLCHYDHASMGFILLGLAARDNPLSVAVFRVAAVYTKTQLYIWLTAFNGSSLLFGCLSCPQHYCNYSVIRAWQLLFLSVSVLIQQSFWKRLPLWLSPCAWYVTVVEYTMLSVAF